MHLSVVMGSSSTGIVAPPVGGPHFAVAVLVTGVVFGKPRTGAKNRLWLVPYPTVTVCWVQSVWNPADPVRRPAPATLDCASWSAFVCAGASFVPHTASRRIENDCAAASAAA